MSMPPPGSPYAAAPGPPYAAAPVAPVPVPAEALAYHELQRGGREGIWRPLVGSLLLGLAVFVVVPIAMIIPFAFFYVVTGAPLEDSLTALVDLGDPTPAGLAYLNIVLASAIPIAWLLSRTLHGMKPRWLASVRPRIRWGYFGACLLVALVALVASLLVSLLLPDQGGAEISGDPNAFDARTRDFLLVVLLLTPLQAAGEEYFFRGYLTQAFGGVFSRVNATVGRVLAVVGPAVLFALAHGLGQDPPIFFDRLAFGLVAGTLVILTGGLEAGIAMHVLNNFLAFGLALAFSDMATALNPTGGSWWSLPSTLTQSLVFLALAVLVARRMGLRTVSEAPVLVAPRQPVYRFPSA